MEYDNRFEHVEAAADSFRNIMVDKLRAKQHKGNRPGWRSASTATLINLLRDEVVELRESLCKGDPEAVADEAADVANFAMMVADVYAHNSGQRTRMEEPSQLAALRQRAEEAELVARLLANAVNEDMRYKDVPRIEYVEMAYGWAWMFYTSVADKCGKVLCRQEGTDLPTLTDAARDAIKEQKA